MPESYNDWVDRQARESIDERYVEAVERFVPKDPEPRESENARDQS